MSCRQDVLDINLTKTSARARPQRVWNLVAKWGTCGEKEGWAAGFEARAGFINDLETDG